MVFSSYLLLTIFFVILKAQKLNFEEKIFRSIENENPLSLFFFFGEQKSGQDHVDVITFYNEVFILSVKPLLLELVPSETCQKGNQASEANSGKEGFKAFPDSST